MGTLVKERKIKIYLLGMIFQVWHLERKRQYREGIGTEYGYLRTLRSAG